MIKLMGNNLKSLQSNKKTTFETKMNKIKVLCASHNVKTLFAFGSVCTDKFEEIFQRPVDLVTDKSLSNPFFIESVNQTKIEYA